MSAEDRLNEKPSRRRGLRRQAEEEAVQDIENEEDDDEGQDEEAEVSTRGITAGKGRPTPSRRTQETEIVKHEGNFITRTIGGIREYFEGVNSERAKIVWPTREETRRLTYIVLVVTIIASIALGVIALVFNAVLDLGLKSPLLVYGGLFAAALIAFVVYVRNSNRHTGSF